MTTRQQMTDRPVQAPPRLCNRAYCENELHQRVHEKTNVFLKRRYCSITCASRCSGWGHRDARRSA